MSTWPLISDFARMVQNPQVAFRTPELKQSTVELNHLGQPKARSGNFATVYRAFRPDGNDFAVRVFNRRQDERLEHYQTVSDYLDQRAVSSIVNFDYDERGIRSAGDGKLYPLLTMDWVPGITLFEWARDRSREGYAEALTIAADVWLHLVRELSEHQIVHGDLSHGNVLVSPEGHFKLVDYDCMCVPSLIGRRNLETGLPPYQHPARNADTVLFPGLDNFSSLVIYVALRALAAAPHLWITYVDQMEYDRILFRPQDFENPAMSPLYRDLMNSPDEQVRDLAHYLFQLARYDIHDIPPVDEVLLWCESVESLVSAQEWDKVVQLVERMGPGEQIAPELQPFVQEAQQRVSCKKAVEEALAEGNEERVEMLYATGLLHNYPAAEHLAEQAKHAGEVRPILRILQSAQQLKAWDKLKTTWVANQHVLAGRVSTQKYETDVQKLLTVDRIRDLLASPQVDNIALLEAWQQLQEMGGHPTAEQYRVQVEKSLAQRQSMTKLQELLLHAPKTPSLSHDKKIVACGSREAFQAMDKSSPLVQQYLAAQKRVQYVKKVHEVEKKGTIESEKFIAGVMKHLPNSYHEGLARRSQQARRRLYVCRDLKSALEEPCSEVNIVKAWEKLGEVRGRVLASDEIAQRAQLAEARVPLIQKLQAIPKDADEADQERYVVEIWDPALLDGCHDASAWQGIYDRVRAGRETLQMIENAVEAENLTEAERLLGQPCMEGQQLPLELTDKIKELRAKVHKATAASRQAIVTTLMENDRPAFAELFDAGLVRDICTQFRHHQPVVSQWVESEIIPLSRVGLATDPESAVVRDEEGNLTIKWTWPAPSVSNDCRMVICQNRPPASALPEDVKAQYSAVIQRHEWDEATGHQIPQNPELDGSDVYVWAVIDLGYQTFFTEPFRVGRIQPVEVKKQRRWGLFRSRKAEKAAESAEDEEAKTDETEQADEEAQPPAETEQSPAAEDTPEADS